MATLNYYLKNPKEKESSIFFKLHYGAYKMKGEKKVSYPFKYYIGEKIFTSQWNTKKQRAKESSSFPQYPEFNQKLSYIEMTALGLIRKLECSNVKITHELIKAHLDALLKEKKDITDSSLPVEAGYTSFDLPTVMVTMKQQSKSKSLYSLSGEKLEHVTKYLASWRMNGKKSSEINQDPEEFPKGEVRLYLLEFMAYTITVKKSTIQNYKLLYNCLGAYERKYKKVINFNSINMDFYYQFLHFLQEERGLGVNTIGTRIKDLKAIMERSLDAGLHSNVEHKKKAFKKIHEEIEAIYLSDQEIKAMYDLNLNDTPELDRTRDWFVISCLTGLRYSDLCQFSNEHIQEGNLLVMKTKKTEAMISVPLHTYVKEIIKKYNGNLPPVEGNGMMNLNVKKVAKLASIISPITITEKDKNNEIITYKSSKYELVTVHTGRRSFVTNAILQNIPTASIMKMTGHTTEKELLRYARMTVVENADNLKYHEYFNVLDAA